MEDEHLMNTIRVFLKKVKEAHNLLVQWFNANDITNIYSGINKMFNPADIKEQIAYLIECIHPYVFEASIRWLPITNDLQLALWRSAFVQSQHSLPEEVEEVEEEYHSYYQ